MMYKHLMTRSKLDILQVVLPHQNIKEVIVEMTKKRLGVTAVADENEKLLGIITDGDQILLGGNDQYIAMCHRCWTRKIREQNNG